MCWKGEGIYYRRNLVHCCTFQSIWFFSGKKIRTKVLTTENASWTNTSRKTRCDALSDDLKKTIYDFWISPENARPTANKKDIKRVRLGPKLYAESNETEDNNSTESNETEDNNSTTVQCLTKHKITILQQYRVKRNRRYQ